MKFLPTNINLNTQQFNSKIKIKLDSNLSCLNSHPTFSNQLDLLLTTSSQGKPKMDKETNGEDLPLVFLLLSLINSNESFSKNDLIKQMKNNDLDGIKKMMHGEIGKLIDMLKKGVSDDPKLNELIIKLQKYLSSNDCECKLMTKDLNSFMGRLLQDDIHENNNHKENDIFFNVNVNEKKYSQELQNIIKELNDYISHNHPEIINEIKNILNTSIKSMEEDSLKWNNQIDKINKKNDGIDVIEKKIEEFNSQIEKILRELSNIQKNIQHLNEKKYSQELQNIIKELNDYISHNHPEIINEIKNILNTSIKSMEEDSLKWNNQIDKINKKNDGIDVIEKKIEGFNSQIEKILRELNNTQKNIEILYEKVLKDKTYDLRVELNDIIKENVNIKEYNKLVHNIGELYDKLDKIEGELSKIGIEVQVGKKFLREDVGKEYNNHHDSQGNFDVLHLKSHVRYDGDKDVSTTFENRFRDEIFRQIENGIFRNFGQGRREVSIKLYPPELGTLKVVMQVQNREVSMVLHTQHRDVADALNKHIANFEKSFEQQGLKVVKVEVKNDLFSGHEAPFRDFGGSRDRSQNNKFRFSRRSLFGLRLVGERDISTIDPDNLSNVIRINSGSLYVVA